MKQSILDEAIQDLSSIQDVIRWGYSRFDEYALFYGHGTDNPWDEAVALVLQSLSLPDDTPDTILQCRLTKSEKQMLVERIGRRINEKIPLAYLTNKANFCGSEYYVDERVLVPRSPIAELIEGQFQPWIDANRVNNILDLCTGSGCIAIACGQYFPHAVVDGGDISVDCIDVAEINREKLQQENVSFYQSDLFDQIPQKRYDIIVSNPPYVDEEDFDEIPEEFLAEPKLGLVSGVDGLDLTHRLLKQANAYLEKDGILVVEVGNSAAALEHLYPTLGFTWLEFERGGHGVFLLTKEQLENI
ncbi:50S ribosomal protein L3 N(5)-glutamine methyltransferase [Aliikangiella coralliicola]|uniref:Ribosomal protein uL3 glutamine methyltransferase n=1 Tax=Aliikangiella coralliicola TaxID=2592383 RepID=A0A545UBB1_9GAMM|nr:50S ribosomal protein L3 N(5)-glutamine methyltransferase [Aliikangiella coralliicola]